MSRSSWIVGSAPSTETRSAPGVYSIRTVWVPPSLRSGTRLLTTTAGASAEFGEIPWVCTATWFSEGSAPLTKVSSSIAIELGTPLYPRLPPALPNASCALRWITNAMPSAAPTIRTVNSQTKGSTTFCRWENHAAPAWPFCADVRRRIEFACAVEPTRLSPLVDEKSGKLMSARAGCASRSRGAADLSSEVDMKRAARGVASPESIVLRRNRGICEGTTQSYARNAISKGFIGGVRDHPGVSYAITPDPGKPHNACDGAPHAGNG